MLAKLMQFWVPEFVKKMKLRELFRLTADAFQSDVPELRGLSFSELLARYAVFTKEQAESYLRNGRSLDEIRHRLYRNSHELGQNLRRSLRIATWEDVVMALGAVYKLLEIGLRCDMHGDIIVERCFFSTYYSGKVCALVSALDEGLAAGLSGGGRLCFSQRITEGGGCCKASLTHQGASK